MIGKMRHRITIQELTIVDEPGGGSSETWIDELTTWAEVKPLRSSRSLQDNQVALLDGYRFVIRWAVDRTVDKERRVSYGGKLWTINSIIQVDEAKRFYEITAIAAT